MIDHRTIEGLSASLDKISNSLAAARLWVDDLLAEHPKPPTYELDTDAVEAAMRGAERAWTAPEVARATGLPLYRARAALRSLVGQGYVVLSGRTRGTRYRLAPTGERSGEPDPWPTGL